MSWSLIGTQIGMLFISLGLLAMAYCQRKLDTALLNCLQALRQNVKLLADTQSALEHRVKALEEEEEDEWG